MTRQFAIALSFVLLFGSAQAGLAQQSGAGLRIMEPEADGICKDEAIPDCAALMSNKQTEMMQEMMDLLKRTAAVQKKLSKGPGSAEKKEISAELGRLREETNRLMSELQSLTRGKSQSPQKKTPGSGPARR